MIAAYTDIFIGFIFLFALISHICGLPPLIGFLFSGFFLPPFLLRYFGTDLSDPTQNITQVITAVFEHLSELGVSLLLFSIGLKLKLKEIFNKESLVISLFQAITVTVVSALWMALAVFCLPASSPLMLSWRALLIVGFALSCSSTVLAMKFMQDRGEYASFSGKITTSVIILQDIMTVAYLVFSEGHVPSLYALAVPFIFMILRPLAPLILNFIGRSELLTLSGLFFALLPGAAIFRALGLHGDLGALTLGCFFAGDERSQELSSRLSPLKDIFLICYFMQIGFNGLPTLSGVGMASFMLAIWLSKGVITFAFFKFFRFRVRTSLLSTFYLTNFSEFGLLVASHAVASGQLSSVWLPILALAAAISFTIAKPVEALLPWLENQLIYFFPESNESLNQQDQLIALKKTKVLILGMGRVGTGAYNELATRYGDDLALGIELSKDKCQLHIENERHVVTADATDPDLWNRMIFNQELELILLTMSNYQTNVAALNHLKKHKGFSGRVAAIVIHEDERMALRAKGIDAVFNVYSEAGTGFAMHLIDVLNLDEVWPKAEPCLLVEPDEDSEF